MKQVNKWGGYTYYLGCDENGVAYYNICPSNQSAPTGGYYSRSYIVNIKNVLDLFIS